MKQVFTLFLAVMLSLNTISLAFSGGASWHMAQARMRKAARVEAEKNAEFWNKHDDEMARIERALDDTNFSISKSKGRKSQVNE